LFPDFVCQKLSKLASASRSYTKNESGTAFLRHGVVYSCPQNIQGVPKNYPTSSNLYQIW